MSERRKNGVSFAERVGFKVSFLKISQCQHVRVLYHNIVMYIRDVFELCRYRVANFTSSIEIESLSVPVAKNRIEFQWGSKLLGTSLEALNVQGVMVSISFL